MANTAEKSSSPPNALLDVWVDDHLGLRQVGVLEQWSEAGHAFQNTVAFYYLDGLTDADAISITMPIRRAPYQPRVAGLSGNLPPIFDQNIPEGALRDYLIRRYLKVIDNMGDFDLLRLAGNRSIGRVRVVPHGEQPVAGTPEAPPLSYVLANPDAQAPLKASARDFPYLAINEYLCLYAAQMSGLPTAKVQLSDDGQVLAITRFDRDAKGALLGFEDMACLSALTAQDKYKGSYEDMVRTLSLMIEPAQRHEALAQVFKSIALSCVVGNGDAHLKNFGLLYADPTQAAQVAPAYDICCTVAYLREDQMALSLNRSKRFPNRASLTRFGRTACRLSHKEVSAILADIATGVESAAVELAYYRDQFPEFDVRAGEAMHTAWTSHMRMVLGLARTYTLPESLTAVGSHLDLEME